MSISLRGLVDQRGDGVGVGDADGVRGGGADSSDRAFEQNE
ncbi:hypothetical protein [Streptomyces sp. NPDC050287]